MYLPIETSTVPGGPVNTLYNVLKRNDNRDDREKGEEVRKGD